MTSLLSYTELLWEAKEVFRFPEKGKMADVSNLLQWGFNEGDKEVGDIKEQVERELYELEPIKVDYTKLFINGYPNTKAHPFAGWYMGEQIVYGDNSRKLEKLYAEYGVFFDEQEAKIPADHIMVELEFLAVMAEEYLQSQNVIYQQALLRMINEHMQEWLFRFLNDIEVNAETAYYKILANAIRNLFLCLQQELKGVA